MLHLSLDELTGLAARALVNAGASKAMAAAAARCLVAADAEGLATHGVARVPTYCSHLETGRARGAAVPRVAKQKKAACLIDAGDGLAFQACELAIAEAVRRAGKHGVGLAAVTHSHHCGALGVLLEPVAAAGMAGLAFSNAAAAIMPWGGTKPLFGTNPVAAIFPRRGAAPPLVIDFSLTQVTRGSIMLLAKAGKPIPEGWGMDAEGRATTDPEKILVGGSLNAVGGLKGTLLAMAVEILACVMTGAALSHEVKSMHLADGPPLNLGQVFVAIDPGALNGRDSYLERIETLAAMMAAEEGVRLPGARRSKLRSAAENEGIEIDEALAAELYALAGGEATTKQ